MPNKKFPLTDAIINAIEPSDKQQDYWDGNVTALLLRVYPTGRKSWLVFYRVKGIPGQRKKLIEAYPKYSIAKARSRAKDVHAAARKGIDLFEQEAQDAKQKQREAQEKAARKTFRQLADDYIELHARPHKKSWQRDQDILDRDVLKHIGSIPLEVIRKADIADVTRPILKRGSPSAANHCFEVMRAIFNWGANEGYGGIEYSPMTGMKAPAPKGDGRERVLSEEEIRIAWDWFENGSDMHELTRLVFKLILVTGQRPGEVCQMEKEHVTVYGNHHIWTIPGAIRKTDQTHVVPLSGLAIEILEQIEDVKKDLDYVNVKTYDPTLEQCLHCGKVLPRRSSILVRDNATGEFLGAENSNSSSTVRPPHPGTKFCSLKCRSDRAVLLRKANRKPIFINSPFVFPSPQYRGKCYSESTLNTALKRGRDNDMTLEHWTPHDLRRTCGTQITGLVKESREIMDQVLGHKDGSVGAVYDRYAYFDEKGRALDGWSRELRRILKGEGEGSKVIPLYG
jgi:integrase